MRLARLVRNGYTFIIVLSSEEIEMDLRMQAPEVASMVTSLLMELASFDPLKWSGIFDDARNAQRQPAPQA